jgi:endonuclease/exonuclease/phosphatase family metal-dependent hydrolase
MYEVYATHDKYSYCSKLDLDWNQTRCPKILQTITSTDADIVCLQEVQIDTWYSDFLPYFQTNQNNHNTNNVTTNDDDNLIKHQPLHQQYICILQNVTRNHPIACAILIKSSKFQIHMMESRSRALLLVLQVTKSAPSLSSASSSDVDSFTFPIFDDTPASFLYIANVHLDARYDQDITRYNQIKSLLHRIEFHWKQNTGSKNSLTSHRRRSSLSSPPPPPKRRLFISDTATEASLKVLNNNTYTSKVDPTPTITSFDNLPPSHASTSPIMIIAGDFNMVRTNPIYKLLSTGQYKHGESTKKSTSTKNSRDISQFAIQLPFLPLKDVYNSNYDQKLHQKIVKTPSKNSKTRATAASTFAVTTSSINSVNHTVPLVLRRTFAGGSILDYIWIHAERVHAVPWLIDPMSSITTTGNQHLENVLAPPLRFRWPSPDQPSDHVPIGIRFFLT